MGYPSASAIPFARTHLLSAFKPSDQRIGDSALHGKLQFRQLLRQSQHVYIVVRHFIVSISTGSAYRLLRVNYHV